MSSSSNLGISPVLLLAVSQSMTTNTKDVSPSASPPKISETQTSMENGSRSVNQDLLKEIIKSHAKSNGDKALNIGEKYQDFVTDETDDNSDVKRNILSTTKQPHSEMASTDLAMASVLTTLSAQSQALQESEHSPIAHIKSMDTHVTNVLKPCPSEDFTDNDHSAIEEKLISTDKRNDEILLKTAQTGKLANIRESQFIIKSEPVQPGSSLESSERLNSKSPIGNDSLSSGSEIASPALNSEAVKTLLKMRLAMQGLQSSVNLNELVEEVNQSLSQSSNEANTEAMINVLTSLAMQNSGKVSTVAETEIELKETLNKDTGEQNRFIISYDPETGAPQVQGIIVSEGVAQVIDQSGNRLLIQSSETISEDTAQVMDQATHDQGETYTTEGPLDLHSGSNVTVYTDPNATVAARSPCPVCGDTISGFHYGIFTCESCKGFFKRTVQNKKTFLCHRQGECEINLENRKKCPACRFAKCLVMGMKLEAIRADRTRGGRSSYGGSPASLDQKLKTNMSGPVERKKPRLIRRTSSGGTFDNVPETSQGSSHLVAVLNNGDVVREVKPFVPQILTDIMNLESLLCDDEIPQELGGDRLNMSDPSVFLTFLQLAELKLYKIVRWARNLPYFANISTDDQILLLQNCWCELLTLTMCWRSMQLHNEVIFFHGQSLDEEKAAILGIEDMFQSILALIENLRRLHLDQYECVALKVIILICPDMKGLKDVDKLAEQQQRISGALETYTSTHYRQSPNKFGELILRLSELSRISFVLKSHLVKWMPPNSTSCGLLFELLKGENMKDLM